MFLGFKTLQYFLTGGNLSWTVCLHQSYCRTRSSPFSGMICGRFPSSLDIQQAVLPTVYMTYKNWLGMNRFRQRCFINYSGDWRYFLSRHCSWSTRIWIFVSKPHAIVRNRDLQGGPDTFYRIRINARRLVMLFNFLPLYFRRVHVSLHSVMQSVKYSLKAPLACSKAYRHSWSLPASVTVYLLAATLRLARCASTFWLHLHLNTEYSCWEFVGFQLQNPE
jgi:hypothetical protein